jgi:hypothetical protein
MCSARHILLDASFSTGLADPPRTPAERPDRPAPPARFATGSRRNRTIHAGSSAPGDSRNRRIGRAPGDVQRNQPATSPLHPAEARLSVLVPMPENQQNQRIVA